MNLHDFNSILLGGYPSYSDLAQFPLGKKLQELDLLAWTTTARMIKLEDDEPTLTKSKLEAKLKNENRLFQEEELGEVYHHHIESVMRGINMIIGPAHRNICPSADWVRPPLHNFEADFLDIIDDDEKALLRFLALYHDIGKVIHRDKHPLLGKHLLESLDVSATNTFCKLLGVELFSAMVQIINHHDLFGVLNTGEASLLVLIDAAGHRLGISAQKMISYLVTVNLADIYGTLNTLYPTILNTTITVWKNTYDLLSAPDFEKKVFEWASSPQSSADRIKRILTTPIFMIKDVPQDIKEGIAERLQDAIILDALQRRLGPRLTIFCHDLAYICKFDYLLKFMKILVSKWFKERGGVMNSEYDALIQEFPMVKSILDPLIRERGEDRIHFETLDKLYKELQANVGNPLSYNILKRIMECKVRNINIDRIVSITIEFLERLVTNYRDLTYHREGSWRRRIGIEMLGITRSIDISDRVARLLLSENLQHGVNWVADEATAWYFV